MAIDWEAACGTPLMAVFGEAAIYYPSVGAPFDVIGVFDEAYREVTIIDSLSYTSDTMPVIGITDGQFMANGCVPAQNDKLKMNDPTKPYFGRTFLVNEPQPDGHGITKMKLNLAATQL